MTNYAQGERVMQKPKLPTIALASPSIAKSAWLGTHVGNFSERNWRQKTPKKGGGGRIFPSNSFTEKGLGQFQPKSFDSTNKKDRREK